MVIAHYVACQAGPHSPEEELVIAEKVHSDIA
jgi:hypothetical protein